MKKQEIDITSRLRSLPDINLVYLFDDPDYREEAIEEFRYRNYISGFNDGLEEGKRIYETEADDYSSR